MNIKKILVSGVGTALFSTMIVLSVSAAPTNTPSNVTAPGQNKLQCFDGTTDGGYGGTCTLQANGAKGPATLTNNSSNPNGDYSGVYLMNSNLSGQLLSDITMLGYMYKSSTTPTPGALSLNLPISETIGTTVDGYAFVDAYYCPGTDGKVNVITDTNCSVWYKGIQYTNWSQFVSAYPNATVSAGMYVPFIVAERTPSEPASTWTINNVTLGKPGASRITPSVSPTP